MFSQIFFKLRYDAGHTQKSIAGILKVSTSTIGQWETGERMPSIDKLKMISQYFKVTIDFLLENEIAYPNKDILKAYNNASAETKTIINKILDIPTEKNNKTVAEEIADAFQKQTVYKN